MNWPSHLSTKDGWIEGSVKIRLPCTSIKFKSEEDGPKCSIEPIYYRRLTQVLISSFQEPAAKLFKLFWKSMVDTPPERVISEHKKLQSQPNEPGCNLEKAIAAALIFSDSTHLINFGMKYERSKPSSFAAHHFVYMQSLPDNIEEAFDTIFGNNITPTMRTHLKRQLIHAIWELLLDDQFMEAYEHGIVVKCADGVLCRLYPHFFIHGADYPEKVLLATIKSLGRCPCPRCHIKNDQIGDLGMVNDMKRRTNVCEDNSERQEKVEKACQGIFKKGYSVVSNTFRNLMDLTSLNAFSKRLSKFGFNFHSMLAPDLLHEFELGVWKAVFTHLV
ncbi:hypothetical protein K443DRAFT_133777 [Laccaria amethystina LaAM-08-1]|uniref:Uncharacterized protein n=1 Tax=Laccaria amethystina LaAM-08-1 TaxID=1095629 RepID=A0A0C9XJ55_9AGAR|nr:hypothetical protein K443DRAFT_133777 [Laccaria amethystina LaAM-08-1]